MAKDLKADFSRLTFADLHAISEYSMNASQVYEDHFDQNKTCEEQDELASIFSFAAHASAGELERRIIEKFKYSAVSVVYRVDPHDARANVQEERYAHYMAGKL